MYKPPILPATGTFDTPCSVEYRLAAPAEWFRDTPAEDQQRAAQFIIGHQQSRIAQFVAAARQERMIGGMPGQRKAMSAPGITLELTYNMGIEQLIVIVFPVPGAVPPQPLTIPTQWEVDVPFYDWPLPGWQHSETVDGFTVGSTYGNYYYDPFFTPSVPTATDPTISAMDPSLPLWTVLSGNVPYTQMQFMTHSIYNPDMADTDSTMDPNNNSGFVSQWWTNKVGVSGIVPVEIVGQTYLEFRVDKLPPKTALPPQRNLETPAYTDTGSYQQDPTYYWTPSKRRWIWPEGLDTFYSPAFGLVPENFISSTWTGPKKDFMGVLGLDPDPTYPARSISCVRTSIISGQSVYLPATTYGGTWYLDTCTINNTITYVGGVPTVTGTPVTPTFQYTLTMVQDIDPRYPLPVGNVEWPYNTFLGIGGTYLVNGGGGTDPGGRGLGPAAGPTMAQCAASFVGGAPINTLGTGWLLYGTVGQPYQFVFLLPPGTTIDGLPADDISGVLRYSPSTGVSAFINQFRYGDVFIAPDNISAAFSANDTTDLGKLNVVGRHTLVFKGRADNLNSAMTPTADVDISDPNNGVWTGVDLGDLVEKDVVMLAVDVSSRKVWFGKNGKWYDKTGPTTYSPGDPRLSHTTVLDGDHTQKYFPACSIRLGPATVTMLFAGSNAFIPPVGFTAYGA